MAATQGYCEYLLKTLKSRELFEWIELEPKRYWHSLLFMDQYNYGGIQAKDVRPELEARDLSQDPTQNGANDIVSSWNIAEFLPKVTQDYFVVIVSEYIYIPWKHSQDRVPLIAANKGGGLVSGTPSVTISAGAEMEAQPQRTDVVKVLVLSLFKAYSDLFASKVVVFPVFVN